MHTRWKSRSWKNFSRDPGHEGGMFDGGPIFVNIQNPTSPILEGGFSDTGYCHDAQAVIYNGPDSDHVGKKLLLEVMHSTLILLTLAIKVIQF